MTDVIKMGDSVRIDGASQKILVRLNSVDWTYTGSLQDAAELPQNSQVLYRLEEHLVPSGLVEEGKRRTDLDARRFRLTRDGEEWLDAHQEEVARPASRAETQEMAYRAVDEAESAKQSVQAYRKKVHRIDNRLDDLDAVEDQVDENESELGYQSGHIHGLRDRKADESDVERVDERLDEAEQERAEDMDHVERRIDAQEDAIRDLREDVQTLQEENEQLRSELEVLREQVIVVRLRRLMAAMIEQSRKRIESWQSQ